MGAMLQENPATSSSAVPWGPAPPLGNEGWPGPDSEPASPASPVGRPPPPPPDAHDDAKVNAFASSSSGRRRGSVSAAPVCQASMRAFQPPVYEKSYEDVARIKDTIASKPALQVLFGHMTGGSLDAVMGAMFLRSVEVGECVIQQGADGDYFYIVDSGFFDIWVQRTADTPPERVMVAQAGGSFGELALMYNVPRAASVMCSEAGGLWCLERECFQMMLASAETTKQAEYEQFLSQIDVLKMLNKYELSRLSDLLTSELHDDDEVIVQQGDPGDSVYFLYEGEAKAFITGEQGEFEVYHYRCQGEYFGEISLMTNENRRATVRADEGGCVVLKLASKDVNLTVGSVSQRLLQHIDAYQTYQTFADHPPPLPPPPEEN